MKTNINYHGVLLEIEGQYIPEEPEVRYYPDGSGHPGYGSEFIVGKVFVGEVDLYSMLYENQIDEIAAITLDLIDNG